MKSVIISGATGAVGIALINEMVSHDIKVLVLTHKNSQRNRLIPKHPLVSTVDCSLDNMQHSYVDGSDIQYDVFYHLAWAGTTGNDRNNMSLQNQNVKYAYRKTLCRTDDS